MWHVSQRIAAIAHELRQRVVVERLGAIVHGQHRGHVRVHHESGQGAMHEVEIVGYAGTTALGVGYRDHPVYLRQL